MIVGSLLLILVAVLLLVIGLMNGSSTLLVGSIAASLLAAVALVVGARQDTVAPLDMLEEDEFDDGFDEPVRVEETAHPAQAYATAGAYAARGGRGGSHASGPAAPAQPAYGPPPGQSAYGGGPPAQPAYGGGAAPEADPYGPPAYEAERRRGVDETAMATGGAPVDDFGEFDDEDPPDEPPPQIVASAAAARVARLHVDVLVIDGRPRYHLPGCVHLLGRESEPLPVSEAVELGFTPCSLCEPDNALLTDPRRA